MILVTGGAGFIGTNFVLDWLMTSGETLINLDKLTYAGNRYSLNPIQTNPNHIFIQGDIGDRELLSEILKRYQPRAVINFAAESHVDRSIHGADDFIQTNIVGTFGLLESVREYWCGLSSSAQADFRLIHISTDEVYGSLLPSDASFTEQHPYLPNNPYAASKASSDHLMRAWFHTYGLPIVTTHCGNNFGPYQFPEKLIPLTILNALSDKAIPIYGDGQQVRDWIYVKDHCAAIRRILELGKVGDTYNIGGDNQRSNLDVVKGVCQVLDQLHPRRDGLLYEKQIQFIADRPGHDRRYAIDASKLKMGLGFCIQESFESGIQKTVEWYVSHPEWVQKVINGDYHHWIEQQYGDNL